MRPVAMTPTPIVVCYRFVGARAMCANDEFAEWRFADPARFSFFFFFACAASIMKVAAPAMAGKMSFNFIFVLIGLTV